MSCRIGLVGCGAWGAHVLRDLVSSETEVYVAESDEERRSRALERGAAVAVTRSDELPPCDGYVVVVPASAHRAECEALLDRGVPVYVEKPPCTSLADVEALVGRAGGRLFVMHKWRYHPGVRAIASALARGDLGEPTMLETIRTGPEPLPLDVDVTWHLAVHDLSIALELLGVVPTVATAGGRVDAHGRIQRCEALLRDGSGPEHRMLVAAGTRRYVRRIFLQGTVGTAVLADPSAPTVVLRGRDGRTEEIAIPNVMPLASELEAFVDHCAGGPAPKSSGADALGICRRLAEIDAAVRSGYNVLG